MATTAPDYIGRRYGRLTVTGPVERRGGPHHRVYVGCRCDCGREWFSRHDALRAGATLSCGKSGCFRKEVSALKRTKHGLSTATEYGCWAGMLYRCENPKASNYARYGARGITVCKRWHDFSLFLKDIGARPSRQHSIDRIDVNGNYEPNNVRWATALEQAANTSVTVRVVCDGETVSLNEAWKLLRHQSQGRLYGFMRRTGSTAQEAFDHFRSLNGLDEVRASPRRRR